MKQILSKALIFCFSPEAALTKNENAFALSCG